MDVYTVELTIPADNSWTLEVQARLRAHSLIADRPELLPTAKAIVGSGSGKLLLRWVEFAAEGAWPATRAAIDIAVPILPELATVPFVDISAEQQDPGAGPPRGA